MEESESSNLEHECRVCRSGGDETRPLYTPCNCSGSIGLVHQDCLEAWLAHSKKDTCELCYQKYNFIPQYAENTPEYIPLLVLLQSCAKITALRILPLAIKLISAVVIWGLVVPLGTSLTYCTCMRRNIEVFHSVTLKSVWISVSYGIVIDAVLALSMLILVRIFMFQRFFYLHQ